MGQLTVSIAGISYNPVNGTVKLDQMIDARDVSRFSVDDLTGALVFSHGMPVVISDSVMGTLHAGFINTNKQTNLYPNAAIRNEIETMDNHYLADKRLN